MKILFLTPRIPYPPKSGGTLKSWEMLKYLCTKHDVTFASFSRSEDSPETKNLSSLVALRNNILIPLERPRNLKEFLTSYLHRKPLSIYRNWSPELFTALEEAAHSADRILVDHFLMYQYIKPEHDHKTLLHEHNAEHVMWLRYAEQSKNWLKRILVSIEAKRVMHYEQEICQRAKVVLAAPNDIEKLQTLDISSQKFRVTYHLGEQNALQRPDLQFSQTKLSLLYIGSLRWEPNVDGLLWFLQYVWPNLRNAESSLQFQIVGADPDPRLVRCIQKSKGVTLLGFIEDVEPLFCSARVFVSPLRFGSGIKVKVVNALYRGLPTVTTTVGVEGLKLTNGIHAFWSDTPNIMVDQIQQLLHDQALWEMQRNSARILMRKEYTWAKVFANLEEALHA